MRRKKRAATQGRVATQGRPYGGAGVVAAVVAIVLGMAGAAIGAGETGTTTWVSASLRTPKQEWRVASGDSLRNPLDMELAGGYAYVGRWTREEGAISIERENGVRYRNFEHTIRATVLGFGAGYRVADLRDDDDYYLLTFFAEKRTFGGHVGVGFSRTYAERWRKSGAWMGRIALEEESVDARWATMKVALIYEANDTRQRGFVHIEVTGLTFGPEGRFALVPYIRGEFLDDGKRSRESVQAKVRVEMKM